MKDLLLCVQVAVNTTYLDISRCHLADYVKQLQQKRAARAARLFFLIQPMRSLFSEAFVVVALPNLPNTCHMLPTEGGLQTIGNSYKWKSNTTFINSPKHHLNT